MGYEVADGSPEFPAGPWLTEALGTRLPELLFDPALLAAGSRLLWLAPPPATASRLVTIDVAAVLAQLGDAGCRPGRLPRPLWALRDVSASTDGRHAGWSRTFWVWLDRWWRRQTPAPDMRYFRHDWDCRAVTGAAFLAAPGRRATRVAAAYRTLAQLLGVERQPTPMLVHTSDGDNWSPQDNRQAGAILTDLLERRLSTAVFVEIRPQGGRGALTTYLQGLRHPRLMVCTMGSSQELAPCLQAVIRYLGTRLVPDG